ncbi:hypothetical protein I4U23_022663 [Adineta vaga]|nr:hypothetical protein I4U23_022663 [Adineta vaga]
MSSSIDYHQQFLRADTNRKGKIDENQFRSFLGPIESKTQTPQFTKEDEESWNSTPVMETYTYEIGYDVAYYGFVEDPYKYEVFMKSSAEPYEHSYPIGPDVGIGAPNIAHKVKKYDPAGSMFYFADFNHDSFLDETEFNYLMNSI